MGYPYIQRGARGTVGTPKIDTRPINVKHWLALDRADFFSIALKLGNKYLFH